MSSVYEVNKGINASIEFKGLKAQYIIYLAAGLVALFLLFAATYILGVSAYIILPVILLLGAGYVTLLYHLSHKYGQHGLMKTGAYRSIPTVIRCRTRKTFTSLVSKRT
ncbi:fatty acid desaturase [Chitinophaga terrae (ex Kim and Jung 2007)]|uniref:DUF4133 domain-containing protein n=1 Tax=Chitinophaga terrae (ex Kim and Jung 2007) TaxID=408074 RepID=UPI00278731D0|nr:DUF4133 domain-containing protein [Chitinophaga terrae (ex Kim and Jung 2007)]MDQ0107469.1 fatty acid desaturase [Chitinophaga terrae (ex Kim and Jung 2007)]